MICRVDGTGVECMGWPIYSIPNQADGIGLFNSMNKSREGRTSRGWWSRPSGPSPYIRREDGPQSRFLDFLVLIEQIGLAHVIFGARPIAVGFKRFRTYILLFFPERSRSDTCTYLFSLCLSLPCCSGWFFLQRYGKRWCSISSERVYFCILLLKQLAISRRWHFLFWP